MLSIITTSSAFVIAQANGMVDDGEASCFIYRFANHNYEKRKLVGQEIGYRWEGYKTINSFTDINQILKILDDPYTCTT